MFSLPHSTPLSGLRDLIIAGGTLTVCSQCAARRNLLAEDLLPGVRIAGAATFVEEALRRTPRPSSTDPSRSAQT